MNSTIVIAVGIIVLMALIVWALVAAASKDAKKRKVAMVGQLEQLAKAHDTTIGPSDFMGKKVIAQDVQKGKVFYVDHSDFGNKAEVINIADVTGCSLVQVGSKHTESSKSGKVKVQEQIDKIQLELSMKTGDKVSLLFYDEVGDGIMEMLPLKEKAEKWKAVFKG